MTEPKRIPLYGALESRQGNLDKDGRLINGFFEKKDKDEVWVYKRPGLAQFQAGVGLKTGRGIYNWQGDIYAVWDGGLYKNSVFHGVVADGGVYTFSATLGETPHLFLHNGTDGYRTDGSIMSQVTDPDFPTPIVAGTAYLDGTTYIMSPEAGIYGSEINDTTSWDALNVLIAQIEPDPGIYLAKQQAYVIALKGWSTEVFYDKANEEGSPLGTVQGAKSPWGCRHADTVQSLDDILYWVATTRGGECTVVRMEGLKTTPVSAPPVDRILAGSSFAGVRSWAFRAAGHKFYGLMLPDKNTTLVYDIGEKLWYQWLDENGDYWPIVSATFDSNANVIVQGATNGTCYTVDPAVFQDDGNDFSWELYTPVWDGGTSKWKYPSTLMFVGDREPGSILQVRLNDHDYKEDKWTAFREVALDREQPRLDQMGRFRRRAYHFVQRNDKPLRLEAIEMDLDIGTL